MASMGGGQHDTRMPDWQRRILRENRDDIASDLDVTYIMNYMIQNNIFTTAMHETIMSNPTTFARTEAFLDLLPSRGEKAFSTFLIILEKTYPHLHQTLKVAVDAERERRMNMDSEIYEYLDINTMEYTEPSQTEPRTPFDFPQSYVTQVVCQQGDSGLHNREVHPTVEVTADVQGDVVEKRSRQAGNLYKGLVSESGYDGASGGAATASGGGAIVANICVRTPKIGDFYLTDEKVLMKKGSPAVAHDTFPREGLTVVMYRLKLVCVPLSCVQEYGDPEREKWYSPIPLAPSQAEHMLKTESVPGLFVAYTPTWNNDITPYQISLRLPSGIIKHYPVYKFDQGQLSFKNEQVNFKNLKDLVEYHRQNRGILECRLKKSLGEIDEAVTFGKWEIDHADVDFEDAIQLGTGCFSTLHQAMYKNKVVVVKKPKSDAMSKESIVEEAQVLMPLKHNNILRLLGVIRRDEPSLIIECLHDGDLNGWLRKAEVLGAMTRLTICQQVVAGVSYLHEQRYVLLRNLATHNCQVMSNSPSKVHIKLGDFSMARRVKDDCYYAEKEEKKPIRWSSPEVLLEGKYTTKSDTWGVGVVMWEVYTNGEKPFTSLKKDEVVRMVVEVKHSPMSTDRPARCPREISEIIEKCFEYDPEDRPAVTVVGDELAACKEVVSGDNHHLQPVDRSYALRQTLSYCDLTDSQDGNSGFVRGSPGRGGILNRLRRGNRK